MLQLSVRCVASKESEKRVHTKNATQTATDQQLASKVSFESITSASFQFLDPTR